MSTSKLKSVPDLKKYLNVNLNENLSQFITLNWSDLKFAMKKRLGIKLWFERNFKLDFLEFKKPINEIVIYNKYAFGITIDILPQKNLRKSLM